MPSAPEGAVFLNLAPDHLDRHGDLHSYLGAKLRIFANQGNRRSSRSGTATTRRSADLTSAAARVGSPFAAAALPTARSPLTEGTIFYAGAPLLEAAELGLPGDHNVANAMAAAAAALAMGIERDAVAEGLRSFAGVPHRLEPVAEIDGVRFVNDSKATNVASAVVGLQAFERGVHAILGGSEKGDPFAPLIEPIRDRCRACYLIGPVAARLGAELSPVLDAGIALERCDDLEDAVRRAAAAARPGEVVLLSPACASFDAFRDFEARGDRFREIVEDLR